MAGFGLPLMNSVLAPLWSRSSPFSGGGLFSDRLSEVVGRAAGLDCLIKSEFLSVYQESLTVCSLVGKKVCRTADIAILYG